MPWHFHRLQTASTGHVALPARAVAPGGLLALRPVPFRARCRPVNWNWAFGDTVFSAGAIMSILESEAISAAEALFQPAGRHLTAADLSAFPAELSGGPVDYELDNGRLVFLMVPPGNVHGAVQLNIGTQLKIQGDLKGHGKARTETGVILWRNPDRVVTPDVLFIANKSLPIRTSPEGYLETIPELVVEVRSKNDSPNYTRSNLK